MDSEEKKSLIYKFIFILIIAVGITMVVTFKYTYRFCLEEGITIEKEEATTDSSQNISNIATTLKNFRRIIDNYFIGEIDEEKILDETIKGYVKGLDDEYSEYMTKEEWDEFQANALGNFTGIGVTISLDKNDNVVVVSTIKDSPAEKAGLLSEDILVEVDGENVLGLSLDDVAAKIKGEAGSIAKVTVVRKNEYKYFEIERAEIKVYHVEGEIIEKDIAYMSMETFDEGSADEFIKTFNELKQKGAKKLILDLRYNTGGLVDEALTIADYMIDKNKTLLITVDSNGKKEYTKDLNDKVIDMDIVVLTNNYSASSAEILAGALKDHGEAIIVGEKTYGKGVIQNVFSLVDGSVLKLTISEYYTPNETKINKLGITPDYEVKIDTDVEDGEEIVDSQLEKAVELLKSK